MDLFPISSYRGRRHRNSRVVALRTSSVLKSFEEYILYSLSPGSVDFIMICFYISSHSFTRSFFYSFVRLFSHSICIEQVIYFCILSYFSLSDGCELLLHFRFFQRSMLSILTRDKRLINSWHFMFTWWHLQWSGESICLKYLLRRKEMRRVWEYRWWEGHTWYSCRKIVPFAYSYSSSRSPLFSSAPELAVKIRWPTFQSVIFVQYLLR